jgi:hypothetical protein
MPWWVVVRVCGGEVFVRAEWMTGEARRRSALGDAALHAALVPHAWQPSAQTHLAQLAFFILRVDLFSSGEDLAWSMILRREHRAVARGVVVWC